MRVGDNPHEGRGNSVCGETANTKGIYILNVKCSRVLVGRYINIVSPIAGFALCEVVVHGYSAGNISIKGLLDQEANNIR